MKLLKPLILFFYSSCLFLYGQSDLIKESNRLFELEKYEECEKVLQALINDPNSDLSKEQAISVYIDLGKINIKWKKYPEALHYLIIAKSLNVGDSIKYDTYSSTFGRLFENVGAYSLAIEFYKKEYRHPPDMLQEYFGANAIGSLFIKLNEPDSAIHYFKLQSESSLVLSDYVANASSLNNIGFALIKKGETEEALQYFSKAFNILKENSYKKSLNFEGEKRNFIYVVQGNIGACYFNLKMYDKAVPYLHDYFSYSVKSREVIETLTMEKMLVTSYLKLNRFPDAKKVEAILSPFLNDMSEKSKLDYFRLQQEIALYERNFEKAVQINEQIKYTQNLIEREKLIATDNMSVLVSDFLESEAALQIRKEKMNLTRTIELERKANIFKTILLITISIIFIAIVYVFYQYTRNRRKKLQLEKEYLLLEEERLKLRLKYQEDYLTDFAIDVKRKNEQNEKILKSLHSLSSLNEGEIKKGIKDLVLDLKSMQLVDKSVEELNDKSELLLLNFKSKLLGSYPKLSSSDVELCSLIKLNLSNKAIASYRNVTVESVKIFKNRLKKKMNLSGEQSLNEFISSL